VEREHACGEKVRVQRTKEKSAYLREKERERKREREKERERERER